MCSFLEKLGRRCWLASTFRTRNEEIWLENEVRPSEDSSLFGGQSSKVQLGSKRNLFKHWLPQGCQMACFQTKNPNLGKFWRVLRWKMLVYCIAIWSTLWHFRIFFIPFGIFYDYLVYFFPFWYVVPRKIWQPWTAVSVTRRLLKEIAQYCQNLTGMNTLISKCVIFSCRYFEKFWQKIEKRSYKKDFCHIFWKFAQTVCGIGPNGVTLTAMSTFFSYPFHLGRLFLYVTPPWGRSSL
jgi:hypothetical protein